MMDARPEADRSRAPLVPVISCPTLSHLSPNGSRDVEGLTGQHDQKAKREDREDRSCIDAGTGKQACGQEQDGDRTPGQLEIRIAQQNANGRARNVRAVDAQGAKNQKCQYGSDKQRLVPSIKRRPIAGQG